MLLRSRGESSLFVRSRLSRLSRIRVSLEGESSSSIASNPGSSIPLFTAHRSRASLKESPVSSFRCFSNARREVCSLRMAHRSIMKISLIVTIGNCCLRQIYSLRVYWSICIDKKRRIRERNGRNRFLVGAFVFSFHSCLFYFLDFQNVLDYSFSVSKTFWKIFLL